MTSPWFNAAVGVFWVITTGWLIVYKVLPPVLVGTPPNYSAIISESEHIQEVPIGWKIYWDDELVGDATSVTRKSNHGVTEMTSTVELDNVPMAAATPLDLGNLAKLLNNNVPSTLSIRARSLFEVDPLGKLIGFESKLKLGLLREAIDVRGVVDENQLLLTVRTGSFEYETKTYLAADSLVGDAMSPQATLPGLRLNQAWTIPVYNPFLPLQQPMQVLHAKVEQEDYIRWNGELIATWLVVYRSDEGAGLAVTRTPKARAWVRPDGMVLVQEAKVFNSTLRFVRLPAERVAAEMPLGREDERPQKSSADATFER